MKRILSIFAIATVAFAFVACGGKGTKTEGTEEATATETVENVESAASEQTALAQYETLINKAIEVYPKVKAGDADAVKEYQNIAEEMAAIATKLSEEMSTMSVEDAQKFAELGQKLAAAMQ